MRVHLCPLCQRLLMPSRFGRTYRYCSPCQRSFDVDECIPADTDDGKEREDDERWMRER